MTTPADLPAETITAPARTAVYLTAAAVLALARGYDLITDDLADRWLELVDAVTLGALTLAVVYRPTRKTTP